MLVHVKVADSPKEAHNHPTEIQLLMMLHKVEVMGSIYLISR